MNCSLISLHCNLVRQGFPCEISIGFYAITITLITGNNNEDYIPLCRLKFRQARVGESVDRYEPKQNSSQHFLLQATKIHKTPTKSTEKFST